MGLEVLIPASCAGLNGVFLVASLEGARCRTL